MSGSPFLSQQSGNIQLWLQDLILMVYDITNCAMAYAVSY